MKAETLCRQLILSIIIAITFLLFIQDSTATVLLYKSNTTQKNGSIYISTNYLNFTKVVDFNTSIDDSNIIITYKPINMAIGISSDSSTAYICNDTAVLQSTDGGYTWNNIKNHSSLYCREMVVYENGVKLAFYQNLKVGSAGMNNIVSYSDDSFSTYYNLSGYYGNAAYPYDMTLSGDYLYIAQGGSAGYAKAEKINMATKTVSSVVINAGPLVTSLSADKTGAIIYKVEGRVTASPTYYTRIYLSSDGGTSFTAQQYFAGLGPGLIRTDSTGANAVYFLQGHSDIYYSNSYFTNYTLYTRPQGANTNYKQRFYTDSDMLNIYSANATGLYLSNDYGKTWAFVESLVGYDDYIMALPSYAENTTTAVETNFSIGNATYSLNQCIYNSEGIDYLCSNTWYSTYDNGFYCDIDYTTPCYAGCIQTVLDTTLNTSAFFSTGKTCSQIQTVAGLYYYLICSPFWVKFWTPGYGGLNKCLTQNFVPITLTSCSDDTDIHDFITDVGHHYYTEGQCINITCTNKCENSTYTCLSSGAVAKCSLGNNGCYDWSFEHYCTGGDVCVSGNCVPYDIVYPANESITSEELPYLSSIFSCNGKSNTYKLTIWLLISIITAIVCIVFPMALGISAQISAVFGLIGFLSTTIFSAIIGCLPLYVIVIFFVIVAAIIALFLRNIFVSDGGGLGGVG